LQKESLSTIKEAIPLPKSRRNRVSDLEVPHAHIHLVPLQNEGDMNFSKKISDPDPVKMKQLADAIAAKLK